MSDKSNDAFVSVAQTASIQDRMYTKLNAVFPDLSFNILTKPYQGVGQNGMEKNDNLNEE